MLNVISNMHRLIRGFRRDFYRTLPKTALAFRHHLFRKDSPHLLHDMKIEAAITQQDLSSTSSSGDDEPKSTGQPAQGTPPADYQATPSCEERSGSATYPQATTASAQSIHNSQTSRQPQSAQALHQRQQQQYFNPTATSSVSLGRQHIDSSNIRISLPNSHSNLATGRNPQSQQPPLSQYFTNNIGRSLDLLGLQAPNFSADNMGGLGAPAFGGLHSGFALTRGLNPQQLFANPNAPLANLLGNTHQAGSSALSASHLEDATRLQQLQILGQQQGPPSASAGSILNSLLHNLETPQAETGNLQLSRQGYLLHELAASRQREDVLRRQLSQLPGYQASLQMLSPSASSQVANQLQASRSSLPPLPPDINILYQALQQTRQEGKEDTEEDGTETTRGAPRPGRGNR